MKSKTSVIIFFWLITVATATFGQVVYVTVNGAGLKNGTTWSNALGNAELRTYLRTASVGTVFWLAEGKYYASIYQDSSFTINGGVSIYGGFPASGNPGMQHRNYAVYKTIFEGDIDNDDFPNLIGNNLSSHPTRLGNTKKLFKLSKLDTNWVVFDGCTLQNAINSAIYADSCSIQINNCTILNNGPNGVDTWYSSIKMNNTVFKNNSRGFLIYEYVNLDVYNCKFDSNGQAIIGIRSTLNIIGSQFKNNGVGSISPQEGKGIYYFDCNVFIDSCSFNDNIGNYYADIYGSQSNGNTFASRVQNSVFSGRLYVNGSSLMSRNGIVYNCSFTDCKYRGGALLSGADIQIRKCNFFRNSSGFLNAKIVEVLSGNAVIDSCVFISDTGIMVFARQTTPITNCSFISNFGTCINHDGFNAQIRQCVFRNNNGILGAAIEGGRQGGIRIENCLFENNIAQDGAAIFFSGFNHTISNSIFLANSVTKSGAAIYFDGNGPLRINSCSFYKNSGHKSGGLLYAKGVTDISNCVFGNNYSLSGAMLAFDSASTPPSISTIRNCTFNNNIGEKDTGMIFIYPNSTGGIARFHNNIFWNNRSNGKVKHFQLSNAQLYLKNNIIEKQSYLITSGLIDSVFNQSDYPLLKDTSQIAGPDSLYNTSDDGFSLRSCSPAINTGDSSLVLSFIPDKDIAGNDRVFHINIDIGAYEFQGMKTENTRPVIQAQVTNNYSCSNTMMEFRALYSQAGSRPRLKWLKNSSYILNAEDSTLQINNNQLNEGDTIQCLLMSSDSCALPDRVLSNVIKVSIKPKPPAHIVLGLDSVIAGSTTTYSISDTSGSTFNWLVSGGTILSGNGTDSVQVKWSDSSGIQVLKVVEINALGCTGDTSLLSIAVVPADSIALSQDTIYSVGQGDTSRISVFCNKSWQVTINASWVNVIPPSGTGNGYFDIVIASNPANQRSTILTVTSGDSSRLIYIEQAGLVSSIALSQDTIYSVGQGDTSRISVFCNKSWQVIINAPWVNVIPPNGTGNGYFDIVVSSNPANQRSTTITVTCGDSSRLIYIEQAGLVSGLPDFVDGERRILLSPNPTTDGVFTISSGEHDPIAQILIYTTMGRLVRRYNITQRRVSEITLSDELYSGIYFIYIKTDKIDTVVRLVVKQLFVDLNGLMISCVKRSALRLKAIITFTSLYKLGENVFGENLSFQSNSYS